MILQKNQFLLLFIVFSLYVALIVLDITAVYSLGNYVKFAAIFTVFLMAFCGSKTLVVMALFLTVICDYFLLFTDQYTLGVLIFSFVHILYIYLNTTKKGKTAILSLAVLPFLFFLETNLSLVCVFYAFCFALNLTTAFKTTFKTNPWFLVGLILFAVCDILVVIYNILSSSVACLFIWVFYVPSQLIIVLSSSKELLLHKK